MHYRQQASIVTQRTFEVDGMTLTWNQPKIMFHVMWLAELERIGHIE